MIPATDQWGLFAEGIDPAEQRAKLRSLRALAKVYVDPRAAGVRRLLAQAKIDPAALEHASAALNAMDAIDKRRVWASYARLSKAV